MKNSIIDFIHKNHIRAVLSQKDIIAVGHLVVVITHPIMVNLALGIITNRIVRQALVTFNKSEEEEFLGPWTEIECSVQDSKFALIIWASSNPLKSSKSYNYPSSNSNSTPNPGQRRPHREDHANRDYRFVLEVLIRSVWMILDPAMRGPCGRHNIVTSHIMMFTKVHQVLTNLDRFNKNMDLHRPPKKVRLNWTNLNQP